MPVIEAFETEPVWKRHLPIAAVVLVVLLFGGWFFFLRKPSQTPMERAQQLRESDIGESNKFAAAQLREAKKAEEARPWREFLAENYVKQKKPDLARVHYKWLVTNYPKEAKYRKALQGLKPAKPGGKPKKKKPGSGAGWRSPPC